MAHEENTPMHFEGTSDLFFKNSSEPVSEAEALFYEIFNSNNEAIFINDLNGNILAFNQFAIELFGYSSAQEFSKCTIASLSGGNTYNLEKAKEYWEKAANGEPQCIEWLSKRKNNETFWVEVSLKCSKYKGAKKILASIRNINQRKKTEDALAESEEFLRKAQKVGQIGIYKMDILTGYWQSSDVLDEIFGIDANFEKNVEGWAAILHPDWRNEMTDYFVNYVVKDKNRFDKEYKIVRINDKSERWLHGLGDLVFDNNGNPVTMIGTIRDITERKIDQEAIEKAAIQQGEMLANIADVIAIIDENGINRYKSPNIEKWFGWKPSDLVGKNTWINIHPDDLAKSQAIFAELFANPQAVKNDECRYLCKDGTYKWIEYTASNKISNKHINGILLNYHDISERKRAATALQSEQMFSKAILDSLPGIFYLYSYPELRLKQWNRNHEIQLGYTANEMYNKHILEWHIPEAAEAVQTAVDYVMQQGMNAIEGYLVAKDGKRIPYIMTGVRFEMNGQLYLMGVGIDITVMKQNELMLIEKTEQIEAQNEEYQQLNEELTQTNDELLIAKQRAEESDRLKTAFLQNMSHEIRTPMNAIMGFSDLMAGAYNDKNKLEYYSQIINRRCNDLLAIINDILDISKIESGQVTVMLEKFTLSALFNELHDFFTEHQKRLKKENIVFELVIPDELSKAVIVSDIIKIKQILINLIGNAFKFTSAGKITCSCRWLENQNVLFTVSDTGIGIPKDKHNFIFERFAQVLHDKKVLYGGTGLGLSIVKGLTELLKGHIWVESEPG